jgi:hypothetical protein
MFFPIVWKISGKKCNFPVKTIFLKYVNVTTSNNVSVVLQKLLLKLSYLLGRHLSIQNSQNRFGFLSMSFHLLNIYLKTGRFLVITPPSTEIREHSKCRQIYQVLMIVGLVMGTMGSMYYYQEAYSDLNFVKLAATILAGWMLCAFSCRIIMEASRMRGWRSLIKDLRETSCLVQDEEVHTRKVLFKFLGPQIIFWVCSIYDYWFAVSLVGMIYIKLSSVEILEIYLRFFYTLYICTLLEMIRKRYQGLRRRYEHTFFRNRRHLVQMSRFACSLNKVVDTFNDNFGYSLVLLICYVTLESLNYLDFNLQVEGYSNENLIHIVVTQVLSVLLLFVSLPIIVICLNFPAFY